MLDWPNLLVGAVLGAIFGAIVTGAFWLLDHGRLQRERRADVRASWASAAKQLELLFLRRDTTSSDLYAERTKHPIDHWRRVLGPEDFKLLEAAEWAWGRWENAVGNAASVPGEVAYKRELGAAVTARRLAVVAFVDRSRTMQDELYTDVLTLEARRALRAEYRRHPIRTFKRLRREDRAAKEAGLPRGF